MLSHSIMSNFLWPPWTVPPGSSVHGIFQARILQWVAISFSGGSQTLSFQHAINIKIINEIFYILFFFPNIQSSTPGVSGPDMFKCLAAAISSQWLLCGQHVSRISINQEWGSGTLMESGERAAGGQDLSQHLHTRKWPLLRWCELRSCYRIQVCVPNAQWGETSREMFAVGPSKENGCLALRNPKFPTVFGSGGGRNFYRLNVRWEL